MAEQQLLRRECDWCDTVQEFDKHKEETAADRVQAESWIVLVKCLFALGQVYPVQKHACKQSCAENILKLQPFDLPEHVKAAVEQEKLRIAMMAANAKNEQKVAEA
jgi:hypothetical protein